MTMMKAARLHKWGQPLQIDEVPIPEIGDDEVLVRMRAVGLNRGDLHFIRRIIRITPSGDMESQQKWQYRDLPITLLHEGAGTVAKVGSAVRLPIEEGQRVKIEPMIKCGFCRYCRSGREMLCENLGVIGYIQRPQTAYGRWLVDRYREGSGAEYVRLPATNLLPMPDSLPFDLAAKLGILGTAYRACKRAKVTMGDTVVVTAATGGSGIAAVYCAKYFGAAKVIAVATSRERLAKAKEMVDGKVVETVSTDENVQQRIMELTNGKGADAVIDYMPAGVQVTQQAIYALRNGGRAVLVGGSNDELSITYRYIMSRGIDITGTLGWTSQDGRELINLVSNGLIDLSKLPILTFPLEQINEALAVLDSREGGPFWVVVEC